ncbi:MAG: dihydrofolate reductase family protein [Candidatus Eisenbacteria bacterium]|nr:dihydrofolate reductase family protein [Candidatus Eisenbacteria bacterium]
MGRLIVSMNLSLDGYIEGHGQDDGSWVSIDDEVHGAFNELAAGADAFLYGRKVYEVMIPYWPDAAADEGKPAYEREYGRMWIATPKVVVSKSLTELSWHTRVVSSDVPAEIARLKNSAERYVLCYGGSQLVTALQEYNLVDEYALFIHPAALGAGVPFFRQAIRVRCLNIRQFRQGAIGLRYASIGPSADA